MLIYKKNNIIIKFKFSYKKTINYCILLLLLLLFLLMFFIP